MRGNLRPRFIDGSDDELIAATVKHDEAEDVVQTAYMRALTKLDGFHGGSRLSTWLGRIVLNEALGRMRRERPVVDLATVEHAISAQVVPFPLRESSADPEQTITLQQTRRILDRVIDALPEPFRIVLVARLVEGMSIEETASLLGIRNETVKTRLHRARALLRAALEREMGGQSYRRCSRLPVSAVSGSPTA